MLCLSFSSFPSQKSSGNCFFVNTDDDIEEEEDDGETEKTETEEKQEGESEDESSDEEEDEEEEEEEEVDETLRHSLKEALGQAAIPSEDEVGAWCGNSLVLMLYKKRSTSSILQCTETINTNVYP